MKVVILAGGFGTRITSASNDIPKPMITIGNKPIIWHIMKIYSHFGYNDFVIALGYKGDIIKKYFLDYFNLSNDLEINTKNSSLKYLRKKNESWKIKLIDTGLNSMTGGRLKRLESYINTKDFFMTYGDGLSNINIKNLLSYHKKNKKIATVTAVRPIARFGELHIGKLNQVKIFQEKPRASEGWINGGFFVFNKKIFEYIKNDSVLLEREPLEKLAKTKNLIAYKHDDFWQCMDTPRDKNYLEKLWSDKEHPWKVW